MLLLSIASSQSRSELARSIMRVEVGDTFTKTELSTVIL